MPKVSFIKFISKIVYIKKFLKKIYLLAGLCKYSASSLKGFNSGGELLLISAMTIPYFFWAM